MGDLDLEDEEIDAEVLDSMAVTREHFLAALKTASPTGVSDKQMSPELQELLETARLSQFAGYAEVDDL